MPLKLTEEVSVEPTSALPEIAIAVTTVGATASLTGVTAAEGSDGADCPVVFMATAVNVYATPLVKPETTQEPLAPVTVQVMSEPETCGDAVTIYETGVPPVLPAATVTVA